MRRAKWAGLLIAGIVLTASVSWALHVTTTVGVTTAPVTDGPVVRKILTTGLLDAIGSVEVGAQVSGTVESLGADYNSIVHKGQILAELDPATLQVQLEQAQATLAAAQADQLGLEAALKDANVELKRTETLSTVQVVPQADLDAARLGADAAGSALKDGQTAVTRAAASVEEAKTNLEHTTIRSPIDGIAISRDVEVGQTLVSSMQTPALFRIAADLRHMKVQVDIDQADVAGLTANEPVTFEVQTYPKQIFHGILRQVRLEPVIAVAQASVVSYTGIVEVDNANEQLRPGMTAVVTLNGPARAQAVRIPNEALAFRPSTEVLSTVGPIPAMPRTGGRGDNSARVVWKYDGKTFTPITVRTGLTDDQWTELVDGPVHPGDSLVTRAVLEHRSRL